ncbi:hypothetical protein SLA2020_162990 [Shorea laevis]
MEFACSVISGQLTFPYSCHVSAIFHCHHDTWLWTCPRLSVQLNVAFMGHTDQTIGRLLRRVAVGRYHLPAAAFVP